MPLTDQERRCLDLMCVELSSRTGTFWSYPDGALDDLYPDVPSPEPVLTDGVATAAFEIKRVTGDSVLNGYRQSWNSLRRRLAPSWARAGWV